jgi:hypothetical protein
VQVHGGMGFIEETGAAQYLRDAKILTIYEGTTAIQANDFVGRKTAARRRRHRPCDRSAHREDRGRARRSGNAMPRRFGKRLGAARKAFLDAVDFIAGQAKASPNAGIRRARCRISCSPATSSAGWQTGRALLAAIDRAAAGDDAAFMAAKIATARFYGDHILSKAAGHPRFRSSRAAPPSSSCPWRPSDGRVPCPCRSNSPACACRSSARRCSSSATRSS